MKGRRLLALALCAALCVGVAAAAPAADSSDQALKAVTAQVKATLGLDTELYDQFRGSSQEDVLLGKRWNLEWSGDGIWMSVTADDNGKIYSFTRSESVEAPDANVRYLGGRLNIPQLPQDKSQAALTTAQDFLNKVLEAGVETVELKNDSRPSLTQNTYRYQGTVKLNGLESPIRCSVTVRAKDLAVTRFWRSDESTGYLGQLPSPDTSVTADQARRSLKSTLKMEAKYVLTDDGKTAKVRYVPVYGDEYYVDGQTGKLVNLTELRKQLWETGGGNRYFNSAITGDAAAEAPEASMKQELSQAEKEGAAILEGTLPKEELDRILKNAWPEIGLDKYTLANASYSISEEKPVPEDAERTPQDYEVTCRLTYGRQSGQVLANKYVTVDAKTGQLQSLSSRRYYQGEGEEDISYALTAKNGQAKADAILASFAGKNFAALGLFETEDCRETKGWQYTYRYQQTANGYFFADNCYTVGVDATDGTISHLWGSFDEEIELVDPGKVVSVDAAVNAYAAALDLPYGYLEVPVSISLAGSDLVPLLKEAGYSYVPALKTGFVLEQPENSRVEGVDAQTGEAVIHTYEPTEETQISYDDVQGHWVRTAAEALAAFNIGLGGGSLKPADTLTQLDMVALLSSVDGYSYDPATATKEETDWLYNHGYSLGLVTPETRNETKSITRGELVKLILDAAGYDKIAAIPGIFRCDFADRDAIAESQLGYAALAQGLGLVRGGDAGEYAAERVITRAEAIAMLYQYMK